VLERVRDWRTRLIAWSAEQVGKPFVWGETDCASLVRAALMECFGKDVTGVPTWRSKRGAANVLKKYPPLEVLGWLGAEKRTVAFARAGDVVSLPDTDTLGDVALGVWIDGACLVSTQKGGVQLVPAAQIPRDCATYSLWEIHG